MPWNTRLVDYHRSPTLLAAHLNAHEYKHEFHIMSLLQQKNLIHFTVAQKIAKCDDYKYSESWQFQGRKRETWFDQHPLVGKALSRKRNMLQRPSILTSGSSFLLENSQGGRRLSIIPAAVVLRWTLLARPTWGAVQRLLQLPNHWPHPEAQCFLPKRQEWGRHLNTTALR